MSIKIHGCHGNIFARKNVAEDATSHKNLKPSSPYAISYIKELQKKTDSELLKTAFKTINYSKYADRILGNFYAGGGRTITHDLNVWYDSMSGKDRLLKAIEDALKDNHSGFHAKSSEINLTNAIRNNWPSFRVSFANMSEMIAIGGVQEVEVMGELKDQSFGYDFLDRNGRMHNSPHKVRIDLTILLKDWFGVDENDFTNNRPAAILDREGLASLWVLQHQRGYDPFVHIFKYEYQNMDIKLGTR